MKSYLIGGLVAMAVGVMLATVNLALGLLIAVAGLGVIAYGAIGGSAATRQEDVDDGIHPEFRVYLVPIKKLQGEIEELVQRNQGSTTIRVVGAEALEESKAVFKQAAKMVSAAVEVKRALRGKASAEADVVDLDERLKTAQGEEKNTLERALEARRLEVERYRSLEGQWDSIQANLRQAEAGLAEVKARLILVAGRPGDVADGDDELRDQLSRLRALSDSFGESDELLEERNR